VRNALNGEVREALWAALDEAEADAGVKALVITGAGDKAFVAGADIRELKERTPVGHLAATRRLDLKIEGLSKPVVAAVSGYALGGGCELAMACTLRVASENARFGQPEINLGIIPGMGGTQRLSRLCGVGHALRLCLTGDIIDADEAFRIGLANQTTAFEWSFDDGNIAGGIEAPEPGIDQEQSDGHKPRIVRRYLSWSSVRAEFANPWSQYNQHGKCCAAGNGMHDS